MVQIMLRTLIALQIIQSDCSNSTPSYMSSISISKGHFSIMLINFSHEKIFYIILFYFNGHKICPC